MRSWSACAISRFKWRPLKWFLSGSCAIFATARRDSNGNFNMMITFLNKSFANLRSNRMKSKAAAYGFISILVTFISCSGKSSQRAVFDLVTYVELTISDADSMDPAWAYETASNEVIRNVYEPLFAFDGVSTMKLVP